ncbi:MAG: hypothetical protein ACP5GO_00370 [Thermoprotei archaeon]
MLSVPSYVEEEASHLLADPRISELRSCYQRVAISLLVASRKLGVPLSTDEVVVALGIKKSDLLKALWKWKKTGGEFKEISDEEWIPQIAQKFGLPPVCERRAREISSSLRLRGNLDAKKRALISCYISGLEQGISPRIGALKRGDRLWLLRFAGFGHARKRPIG